MTLAVASLAGMSQPRAESGKHYIGIHTEARLAREQLSCRLLESTMPIKSIQGEMIKNGPDFKREKNQK